MTSMKHIPSTPDVLYREYSAHSTDLRQSYESTVQQHGKAISLRHTPVQGWPFRARARGRKREIQAS